MVEKLFRYISFLKYPAYLTGYALNFYELIFRTPDFLDNVGLSLFLVGLALNFESFTPKSKFTKREIKKFSKRKNVKHNLIFSVFMFSISMLIGIFFLKLNVFFPSRPVAILNDFKNLGLGALALSVGGLVYVKDTYERFKLFCEVSQD